MYDEWPKRIHVQRDCDGLFACKEDTVGEPGYVREDIVNYLADAMSALLEMHITHHNSPVHAHARIALSKAKEAT